MATLGWMEALGLLLGMFAFAEIGRRLGLYRLANDPEGLEKGVGAAESSVLALLGLLLAFTFSGAASRLETRKELIVTEANAIGTAFLRVDLLPTETQPELRDLYRKYLDSRLATYSNVRDMEATRASLRENERLQKAIWDHTVAALRRPDAAPSVIEVVIPSLNEMIDITTTRTMAARNHPPTLIFAFLAVMCLLAALLVGYGTSVNRKRSWMHTLAFAITLTLTVFVIVDIEYPRLGLIRVDAYDQVFVELRKSMG